MELIKREHYLDFVKTSIKAPESKIINLVGKTGVGKSTLLKQVTEAFPADKLKLHETICIPIDIRHFKEKNHQDMFSIIKVFFNQYVEKNILDDSRVKRLKDEVFTNTGKLIHYVLFDYALSKLQESDEYTLIEKHLSQLATATQTSADTVSSSIGIYDGASQLLLSLGTKAVFAAVDAGWYKRNFNRLIKEKNIDDLDPEEVSEQLPAFLAEDIERILNRILKKDGINPTFVLLIDEFETYEQSSGVDNNNEFVEGLNVFLKSFTLNAKCVVFSRKELPKSCPGYIKKELSEFTSEEVKKYLQRNHDKFSQEYKEIEREIDTVALPKNPMYLKLFCTSRNPSPTGNYATIDDEFLLESFLNVFQGWKEAVKILCLAESFDASLFSCLANTFPQDFKDVNFERLKTMDWVSLNGDLVSINHELSSIASSKIKESDKYKSYQAYFCCHQYYYKALLIKGDRFNIERSISFLADAVEIAIPGTDEAHIYDFMNVAYQLSRELYISGVYEKANNFLRLQRQVFDCMDNNFVNQRTRLKVKLLKTNTYLLSNFVKSSAWKGSNIRQSRELLTNLITLWHCEDSERETYLSKMLLTFFRAERAYLKGYEAYESPNKANNVLTKLGLFNLLPDLFSALKLCSSEQVPDQLWEDVLQRLVLYTTTTMKTISQLSVSEQWRLNQLDHQYVRELISELSNVDGKLPAVVSSNSYLSIVYECHFGGSDERLSNLLIKQINIYLKNKNSDHILYNLIKSHWEVGRYYKSTDNLQLCVKYGSDIYELLLENYLYTQDIGDLRSEILRRFVQSWHWVSLYKQHEVSNEVEAAVLELCNRLSSNSISKGMRYKIVELLDYLAGNKIFIANELMIQSVLRVNFSKSNSHVFIELARLKRKYLRVSINEGLIFEKEFSDLNLYKRITNKSIPHSRQEKTTNFWLKFYREKINIALEVCGTSYLNKSKIASIQKSLEHQKVIAAAFNREFGENTLYKELGTFCFHLSKVVLSKKDKRFAKTIAEYSADTVWNNSYDNLGEYFEILSFITKYWWSKDQQKKLTSLKYKLKVDVALGSAMFREEQILGKNGTGKRMFVAKLLISAINNTEYKQVISAEEAEMLFAAKRKYLRLIYELHIGRKSDVETVKKFESLAFVNKDQFLSDIVAFMAEKEMRKVEEFSFYFGYIHKIAKDRLHVKVGNTDVFVLANLMDTSTYNYVNSLFLEQNLTSLTLKRSAWVPVPIYTLKLRDGVMTGQLKTKPYVAKVFDFFFPGCLTRSDFTMKGDRHNKLYMGGSNTAAVIKLNTFEKLSLLSGGIFAKKLSEILRVKRLAIVSEGKKVGITKRDVLEFTKIFYSDLVVDKRTIDESQVLFYYPDTDVKKHRKHRTFTSLFEKVFDGREALLLPLSKM